MTNYRKSSNLEKKCELIWRFIRGYLVFSTALFLRRFLQKILFLYMACIQEHLVILRAAYDGVRTVDVTFGAKSHKISTNKTDWVRTGHSHCDTL